jgi:hypothetical protein
MRWRDARPRRSSPGVRRAAWAAQGGQRRPGIEAGVVLQRLRRESREHGQLLALVARAGASGVSCAAPGGQRRSPGCMRNGALTAASKSKLIVRA